MKIERWQKISLRELEELGYQKIDGFGNSYIIGKGEERFLYDPETETVGLVYDAPGVSVS